MKRFKNILVLPASMSADDDALIRAVELAESNAARLTLIWPVESLDAKDSTDLTQRIAAAAGVELEALAAPLRQRGLLVETMVAVGTPFVEVVRQVTRNGHDLLVKTARGSGLFRPILFGSTALHLLRKCPCAVWVVKPDPVHRRGSIVAAVDPDTDDPVRLEMNQKIMDLATSLASLQATPLHVVHAWAVPHEDTVRHSPFLRIAKREADTYVAEVEARHRRRVDAFLPPYLEREPGLTLHFVKGLASEVIPQMARELKAEVIVMATLARDGIKGMLIGNTAEAVISEADCSVLAVKPSSFVSPIAA